MSNPEAERIRATYAGDRYAIEDWSGPYHPQHPGGLGLYGRQSIERALVTVLNEAAVQLAGRTVLDLGCGPGIHLRFLVELGVAPEHCTGVDLMGDRVEHARAANPAMTFLEADALDLDLDGPFDVVCQFTALCNLVEDEQRQRFADTMTRLVAPGGVIVWHDIARQQAGAATRAVPPEEVRELLRLEPVAERHIFHKRTEQLVAMGLPWLAAAVDRHAPQRLVPRTNYVAVFRA